MIGDDALYVRWNGVGGIGDPLDRAAEKVLADVTTGHISKAAAREVYGVVEAAGAVDASATAARRRELRQARLAVEGAQ